MGVRAAGTISGTNSSMGVLDDFPARNAGTGTGTGTGIGAHVLPGPRRTGGLGTTTITLQAFPRYRSLLNPIGVGVLPNHSWPRYCYSTIPSMAT